MLATPASAKRSKAKQKPGRPTVVVMDIRVTSDNPKVQQKIVELTAKVRDQISSQTTSANVIGTRKMRTLSRRHRKQMSACYDDCGVEFGLLVGADFVITGHLEPSSSEVLAVLEIHDTRTRNVIATKKVRGTNYFELEKSLLSAVRRVVRTLNNVVMQATDDEVISDRESQGQVDEGETNRGGGTTAGVSPEAEYLPPEEEEEPEEELTPMGERWLEAQEAPPLIENDEESRLWGLGLGINVGYSLNVSSNRRIKDLYHPLFHLGFQAYYQLHPLIQIAIVGDLDFMKGQTFADNGFDYINDPDLEITKQINTYDFKRCNAFGVRPTVRLTVPVSMVEAFLGIGMGMNYVATSGIWVKETWGKQYYQDKGVVPDDVYEYVPYYFTFSEFNFYAAVDFGLMARIMDERLGVGLLVQYKMPSMWRSGTKAKAIPDPTYMDTQDPPFTTPSERDTIHSPIRHVDSINLLTFGLMADWRF
jgi:hypothetical protein